MNAPSARRGSPGASAGLGPFGGALGGILFLAQSISIPFYGFGFGEAAAASLPSTLGVSPLALALGSAALSFEIARFQFGIMAVMSVALLG